MKLITDWGVKSSRLDRLLAAGRSRCDGPIVAGGPDYDPPFDWTHRTRPSATSRIR
jgi:hypothetical protein